MYEILEPHPCEPNSWQLEEIKKVIKENELPDRAIVNRLVEYLWHVTDPEKPLIFCHVTDSERVAITSICHIFTVNYFPWRTIALPALLRVRFYRDLRYFQVEWEHSFAHREVGQYLNSSSGNMIPFGLLNVQECRNIHNLSRGGRPIMDGEGREGIQLDGSLSVINGSRSPQIICEVAVKETYASVVNKAIKWLTDFDSVNLVIIIVAKEQPVLILDKLTSEPDISGQVRLFETMMERMIYDHQMKHMADGEGEQDITVQTLMDQEPLSNLKYEDWLGEYWSEEHPCFIQFIRRPPKHRPGIDLDPEYVFRLPKLVSLSISEPAHYNIRNLTIHCIVNRLSCLRLPAKDLISKYIVKTYSRNQGWLSKPKAPGDSHWTYHRSVETSHLAENVGHTFGFSSLSSGIMKIGRSLDLTRGSFAGIMKTCLTRTFLRSKVIKDATFKIGS